MLDMTAMEQHSVRDLFEEQRRLINRCFDEIDHGAVASLADRCMACRGTVFFAGVGKSGFVAHKIAQTLVSFGLAAAPLSVTDAMHGDLGAVDEESVCVLLSKSGETDEIIRIIPFIRKKGATVVAVTCKPDTSMGRAADTEVVVPLEKELCPFGLAPVTSAAVQLLFGDTLAVHLMRRKGTTIDQYARNHPGGSIGRKITLEVADVMRPIDRLPLVTAEKTVCDAMVEMSGSGCGCVLVVDDEGRLEGVFTDGDLRRGILADGNEFFGWPVGAVMTKNPRVVDPVQNAAAAMLLMRDPSLGRTVMFFPVIKSGKLIGLLMLNDLAALGLA
nr:putative arabinose-5-phosphate isomerase [Oceanusvirus sp.]